MPADKTPMRIRDLISLADACKLLPTRDGKEVSPETVYCWATRGLRGHTLETWRVGGRRCTTEAALEKFVQATSGKPEDSQRAAIKRSLYGEE